MLPAAAAFADVTAPGTFPVTTEPATLTVWNVQPASVEDYWTNDETIWYEEKTGVHVEWQTSNTTERDTNLNMSIASGDYPDIYFQNFSGTKLLELYQDGVIIPLNDLIDQNTVYIKQLLTDNPQFKEAITAPDGNIYSLFNAKYTVTEGIFSQMWVYTPWLTAWQQAAGKDDTAPATTEEFQEMLRYFRDNDMNGNGDPKDEIPLTGNYQYWQQGSDPLFYLLNAFALTPCLRTPFLIADAQGNVTAAFSDPAFRQGLTYVRELYEEGLLAEETYVQDLSTFRAMTSVSPANVIVGAAAAPYPMRLLTYGKDTVKYTDYTAIAPLKGPQGVQVSPKDTDYQINLRTVITTGCKDPVLAIRWLDYLFSQEGSYWTMYFGQEGVHWQWADTESVGGESRAIVRIKDVPATQNFCWPWAYNAGNVYDLQIHLNKAVKDTATDNNVLGMYAMEKYDPYAVLSNFPYNTWCTDQDVSTEYSEMSTLFNDYIIQAMTQFVMGTRDVRNDNDWNAFLSELDNMGFSRYLEVTHKYFFEN